MVYLQYPSQIVNRMITRFSSAIQRSAFRGIYIINLYLRGYNIVFSILYGGPHPSPSPFVSCSFFLVFSLLLAVFFIYNSLLLPEYASSWSGGSIGSTGNNPSYTTNQLPSLRCQRLDQRLCLIIAVRDWWFKLKSTTYYWSWGNYGLSDVADMYQCGGIMEYLTSDIDVFLAFTPFLLLFLSLFWLAFLVSCKDWMVPP